MNEFIFGLIAGLFLAIAIWASVSSSKREAQQPREIKIKYKDGNEETLTGMDWQRYDDVLTIYHYDMEEPAVKEINMDCIESIGYANVATGEGGRE